jgi:hypothetical protein
MENAQKIQSLLGGNPMIKNVLSNPEHMQNAQKMLKSPDVQKQIGGLISNPKVIQQASQVLSGLQQINSTQAGGRKSRRRKRRGGNRREKVKKRAIFAKELMQIHDQEQRQELVSSYCMNDPTAPICKIPRAQLGGRKSRSRKRRGGVDPLERTQNLVKEIANRINLIWKNNQLQNDDKTRLVAIFKDTLGLDNYNVLEGEDTYEKTQDLVKEIANRINLSWEKDAQLQDAHKERVVTVFNEALGLEYTDVENKNNFQNKLIEKVAIFVSSHNALALEIKHGRAGDKYSKSSDAFERNLKGYNILVKSAFKDNIITSKERAELENIRNPYAFFTAKNVSKEAIEKKISKIIGQIKKILKVQPDQGGRKKKRRTKKKKRRRKSTKKRRRRKSRR